MSKSLWSRSFFPVLLTIFIDNFGLAIVYPIFTPLLLKPGLHMLGADVSLFHRTFLLGLLIASFPLAQFFGAPLIGELSDRIGRKKVFIATISGGIIGYFLTGSGIFFRELHLLWIGRAITGFFAGNLTLCLASIADVSKTDQTRTRNFGWIGTIGGISFILAILTGGTLSNPDLGKFFRPDLPFFITGALSCINLWLMITFFKESHIPKKIHSDRIEILKGIKNISTAIRTKGLRTIYGGYFLFMVCWITSMQFLSAYLYDNFKVSPNTITLTFVLIGVAWSFANFVINPIMSRIFPASKTFTLGMILLSIFLFLTLFPREPLPLFLIHFIIAALAAALSWTNGFATVSLNASKDIQGSILGMNQSIVAIASMLGPIIGGLIAGIDIHKLYLFTALCSIAGALLMMTLSKKKI